MSFVTFLYNFVQMFHKYVTGCETSSVISLCKTLTIDFVKSWFNVIMKKYQIIF